MSEHRAVFDARISFLNGGSLSASGFRLDIPGPVVDEGLLAEALVRHLGLAMVSSVEFTDLTVVDEPHKGSREALSVPAARSGALLDLSHTITEGMVTLPGMPGPVVTAHLGREQSRSVYAAGTEFEIHRIDMIANTGTYLDTPFHRYGDGHDLAGLTLERVVDVPANVFHLADAGERGIPAETFFERDLHGSAVLLHTGWDRHFGTEAYSGDAPFLSAAGARHLADRGVALVGIDSINIDDMTPASAGERPAHSILLAAGIPVVEHLTALGELPASGSTFTAVPPKFTGVGTFPVRAFARLP